MCAQKSPAPVGSHPFPLPSPQARIPVMHARRQTLTQEAEGALQAAGQTRAFGTENVYENIGCWRLIGGHAVMSARLQSSENKEIVKSLYSLA